MQYLDSGFYGFWHPESKTVLFLDSLLIHEAIYRGQKGVVGHAHLHILSYKWPLTFMSDSRKLANSSFIILTSW